MKTANLGSTLALSLIVVASVSLAMAAAPRSSGRDMALQHFSSRNKGVPSETGIIVQSYVGPTTPVYRLGDPLVYIPFAADLVAINVADETDVTAFSTNAKGTATVALRPGEYIIGQPRTDAGTRTLPHLEDQVVTVPDGGLVPLTLFFDNGMR